MSADEFQLNRKGTVTMKKIVGLGILVMVLSMLGCESKKDERKDAVEHPEKSGVEIQPQLEQTEKQAEGEAAKRKLEAETMLAVKCPDCGKDLKSSDDQKMMVCTGCGKEISMMTYGEMRMKKILEAAEKMKNK